MISFLVLGLLVQDPAPRNIHYQPPGAGVVEARWDCRGREVRYRLETVGYDVRLASYSGAAGEASHHDLGRINAELDALWLLAGQGFQCTAVADSLVLSGPRKGAGRNVTIGVEWYDDELHLTVQ